MAGRRFRLSFPAHQAAALRSWRSRARGEGAHSLAIGRGAGIAPLAAGFLYEVTEGNRGDPLPAAAARAPSCRKARQFVADNRARAHDSWLWEPVPLPERRRGPVLLVLHAGEPLPRLPVPVESLDLRQAAADLAAAYAIFRRYLFDYRVDLETPQWFLVDAESRVRKIYAEAPDAATAQADLRSLPGRCPIRADCPSRASSPARPRRDYYKFGGALLQAGYTEHALPYLEEMLRRIAGQRQGAAGGGPDLTSRRNAKRRRAARARPRPGTRSAPGGGLERDGRRRDAGRPRRRGFALL